MDTEAIREAITACGGQAPLARTLHVSQPVVWQWANGRRPVPAERCRDIEQATAGRVTRYQLRPDVFGSNPDVIEKATA